MNPPDALSGAEAENEKNGERQREDSRDYLIRRPLSFEAERTYAPRQVS
jgi:hypothetical protein